MRHGTISTTVTHSVTIGTHRYGSPLVVTAAGTISPVSAGAFGVFADAPGDRLVNSGLIQAAAGEDLGHRLDGGGTGADFAAYGQVRNHGTILGGVGVGNGSGGAGILLAQGGQVANMGGIQGGAGGNGGASNGAGIGGAGILLEGAALVENTGTVAAGAAGYGYGQSAPVGAAGILFSASGSLTNNGTITGGTSGTDRYSSGAGGAGVELSRSGVVTNAGTITGGRSAGSAFLVYNSGAGGAGLLLQKGGSVANTGSIAGGSASYGQSSPGVGGTGIVLGGSGSVINVGQISGGYGAATAYGEAGGTGGTGLDLQNGGSLFNSGTVAGGGGGFDQNDFGGTGGVGVALDLGGNITNSGLIIGGNGGYYAGQGGAGLRTEDGGTVSNFGTILGGAAGGQGQGGGSGVYLDGGTLVNAGTIAGGAVSGGNGPGDAVSFGSAIGTLVVDAGAVFMGAIVANAADALVLADGKAGTLSGFGTSITGFSGVDEDAHAHWVLQGTVTAEAIRIGTSGWLALDGKAAEGTLSFHAGGTLQLDAPSSFKDVVGGFSSGDTIALQGVTATSLGYNGGTLTLYDASHNVVDSLQFNGSYTQADFALMENAAGTDIVYAGDLAGGGIAWRGGVPLAERQSGLDHGGWRADPALPAALQWILVMHDSLRS